MGFLLVLTLLNGLTLVFQAAVQPVSGQVDWKFPEQAIPRGGYEGQCCFWASEFLLNTGLGTLAAPGKLQTTLDAAQMVGSAKRVCSMSGKTRQRLPAPLSWFSATTLLGPMCGSD